MPWGQSYQLFTNPKFHESVMADRDFDPRDGKYIRIMNEFVDKLIVYRLDSNEWSIIMLVIRRTWGVQGQAWADLKWLFIREATQLGESSLTYALRKLKARNIIHTRKNGHATSYKINSKVSTWKNPDEIQPFRKNNLPHSSEVIHLTPVKQLPHSSEVLPIKDIFKDKFKNNSPRAALKIMDQEVLEYASLKKVITDTDVVCQKLVESGIFPKAYAFRNSMMKKNQNERAILHALSRCFLKSQFEKGPWQYCLKIIKVENGNYNERDYNKTT